jgi:hypothetical protein
MRAENHYEFTVEHDALGTLTWSVWEYPEGVYNEQETDSGPHKVIENLGVGIEQSASRLPAMTPSMVDLLIE